MSIDTTFAPKQGSNEAIVTGATASVVKGGGSKSILLTNTGTVTVHVRTGDSTVVATAADYPVLAQSQVSISKPQDHDYVATFSAAVGAIMVMSGEGF